MTNLPAQTTGLCATVPLKCRFHWTKYPIYIYITDDAFLAYTLNLCYSFRSPLPPRINICFSPRLRTASFQALGSWSAAKSSTLTAPRQWGVCIVWAPSSHFGTRDACLNAVKHPISPWVSKWIVWYRWMGPPHQLPIPKTKYTKYTKYII